MRWLLAVVILMVLALPAKALACEQVEATWYNPTGWQGCEQWGTGTASTWQGPSAASNDCLYPWTDCAPRIVTSLDTGRSIHVVPRMFCGCFVNGVGADGETARIIDLAPDQVVALGLNGPGLYSVNVEPAPGWAVREAAAPAVQALPDTAADR